MFFNWVLPQAYQRYVARVQGAKNNQQYSAKNAVPASDLPNDKEGKSNSKLQDFSKWQEVASEDVYVTNLDGTPVSFDDWASGNIGHPAYYTTFYNWYFPMIWIAIIISVPFGWYFCLRRIAELVSSFRR